MGEQEPGIWRFDGVELDEQVAQLRVGGEARALDRSGYDVLLALLRNHGDVVTKDELLQAGWPGRIVSENSLAKAVSRLRQVLGDAAGALRVVHGYGYRLAAAVTWRAIEGPPAAAPDAAHLREGGTVPQRPGWRLLRRIGSGGASVAWLAGDRAGAERVFKFATGEAGVQCLKREIALARHLQAVREEARTVAPVLGWNLAQEPFFIELPWFADGNLRDWACGRGDLAGRSRAQRIALCIELCDAVAALHEAGVIHRDLKPENLYPVEDTGAPAGWRVLLGDLGRADAPSAPQPSVPGGPGAPGAWGSGASPGSAFYLAPEVVAGGMATQRSDVFALGVLVFQLVAGDLRRTLAPGWEAGVDDALLCDDIRLAAAADPAQRAIDARGLSSRLRTLDVRHAAEALERARAEQEQVRARQAVRERGRRRLLAAVSGALALGLAATAAMYAEAEGARAEAEREAAQRQAVLDFVTDDILGQADAYRNARAEGALTLVEAVDRAAAAVDARVRDPASAAAVHAMVAAVYFARDRHEDAVARFERARTLYRSIDGGRPDALVAVETGLCDVHRIAGNLARAQQACLSADALARASGVGRDLATLKLGQLRGEQGLDEAALHLLQPLLAADAFASDPGLRGELHWAMGLAERGLGRYAAARRHFEALLALQPDDAVPGTWTAWAYNSLGSVQVSTGDYAAAETTLLTARRIFAATQGAGQVEAQMPNIWRGEIRLRRGAWLEAAALQQALLDAWGGTLDPGHPLRLKAQANLAWAQAEAGRVRAARDALDAALDDRARLFDRPGDEVAVRAIRWTRAALALDAGAQADALLAIVDAALDREFPASHPVRAEVECLHARRAIDRGRAGDAAPRARACAEMLAAFVDATHPLAREARRLVAASAPPSGARARASH